MLLAVLIRREDDRPEAMANLKLLILGPVRLEKNNGQRLGRLGAKVKALLAYLATQPNGWAGWRSRGQLPAGSDLARLHTQGIFPRK